MSEPLDASSEPALAAAWEAILALPGEQRRLVRQGLGLLRAAREPLPPATLDRVAGWGPGDAADIFLPKAGPLLLAPAAAGCVEGKLGQEALREAHRALARGLCTWPAPQDAFGRGYLLRHAVTHWIEAGDWEGVARLCTCTDFLTAKCQDLGAADLEKDLWQAARRCPEQARRAELQDVARAVQMQAHWLRQEPEALLSLLYHGLLRQGWSAERIGRVVPAPQGKAALRLLKPLQRETPAVVRTLLGHQGAVVACAVTPDGRRVISGSQNGTLKVWDLQDGVELYTLAGHTSDVTACTVLPGGTHLLSAANDGTCRMWDLLRGAEISVFKTAGDFRPLAVSADGKRLISWRGGGTIQRPGQGPLNFPFMLKVVDLEHGAELFTFSGHSNLISISAVALSLDGRWLISGSNDGVLKVWDLERGTERFALSGNGDVRACAVSPDGRRLVSGSDSTVKVWDLEHGTELFTLSGPMWACAVSPDGGRLVGSGDYGLKVWDLERGTELFTLWGHGEYVRACAVSPDGRRLVSGSNDGTLRVWDLERGAEAPEPAWPGWGHPWAVSPDGRRAVTGSTKDTLLRVWDLERGVVTGTFSGHRDGVSSCIVMPDGKQVISCSWDRVIKIWDLDHAVELRGLPASAMQVCAVTPDGHRVILYTPGGGSWGYIEVWDLEDEVQLHAMQGSLPCTVTPDSQRLIEGPCGRVWDLERGEALFNLDDPSSAATACAVSPDGQRIVFGLASGAVTVWRRRKLLRTLEGHGGGVYRCAISADGRYIFSTSSDWTIKVWDAESGACLDTLHGLAYFNYLAASPEGLVAGDALGNLWIVQLLTGQRQPDLAAAPLRVFISCNHQDAQDAQLLKRLEQHLKPLERQGQIAVWHRGLLSSGVEWEAQARANLEQAGLILLLLSPAFMAADECYHEMARAVARHEGREARVLAVHLVPVDWQGTPLGPLGVVPQDDQAVSEREQPDAALLEVVRGVGELAGELRRQAPRPQGAPS